MLETQIIILFILLGLSAFFSGIETALMSINHIKVNALLKEGKKGATTLYRIKQRPQRLIITILIGNNLVNIAAASIATLIFTDIFGSNGVGIATGVMTFLILIFGEITPKTFASQNAEAISLRVARPVEILSFILLPFVVFFEMISRISTKFLGSGSNNQLSEAELETIVTMGRKEGILEKEAAEMMHNVLKFKGTMAKEIMIPKVDMVMIDGNKKLNEVFDFIVKTPYSRYPVFERENEIAGILDIDDVLKHAKDRRLNKKVKDLVRPVLFVPETKEIDELLTEFEGKEVPMAIVVDEYGEVEGLVTVEDILEEIVGDIFDKSKVRSINFGQKNKKVINVDAKLPIDDLNKAFNLGIKGNHFNTLAGFIEHKLQRIPTTGEKVKLKRVTLEVVKATRQGIKTVRIIRKS